MKILKDTDFELAKEAHSKDSLEILSHTAAKRWAKSNGLPTPWFGWKRHFLKYVLNSEKNYAGAVNLGDVIFWIG